MNLRKRQKRKKNEPKATSFTYLECFQITKVFCDIKIHGLAFLKHLIR